MTRVGTSAGSQLATDAAARIAERGGNAVDAAVAATLVSLTTDLAFVSPGASGFLAIWPPDEEPLVIDAYAEVPGRGRSNESGSAAGGRRQAIAGGTLTYVGYPSIATPGGFAGLSMAAERFGRLEWSELVRPAVRLAEEGFPLSVSAEAFHDDVGEEIYAWNAESRKALLRPDGRWHRAGDIMHIPGLARSLRKIAEEGVGCLFGGELGRRIGDHVAANGGLLCARDFDEYRALVRRPIRIRAGDWDVALNPPPAVGGVVLAAILLELEERPPRAIDATETRRMVQVLRTVLEFRRERLNVWDTSPAAREWLESLGARVPEHLVESPSTTHVSSVDADGLACAITLSDGYCSGVMVPDTGMWMNNALGELEFTPDDVALPPPGTRLVSNMAPTIARHRDGTVLALGSPGADRITSSLAQVLSRVVHLESSLVDAVVAPRLHVDVSGDEPVVVHEAGLPAAWFEGMKRRELPEGNLYFGSVQAVARSPESELLGVADARRDGVYRVAGS